VAPARPRVELGDERSAERTSAALRPAWDEPEREPVPRIALSRLKTEKIDRGPSKAAGRVG